MYTDIDIGSLPFVIADLKGIKRLPKERGIYILTNDDGEVLYVGATKNFQARWASHHRKHYAFAAGASIHYLKLPEDADLFEVEDAFIEAFKPTWNNSAPDVDLPDSCRAKVNSVNIRLDSDTKGQLVKLSANMGLTLNAYVTVLIKQEYAKLERKRAKAA